MEAQEIIAKCLAPDSGIDDRECINRLLAVLDSPEAVEIYENVSARRAGGYKAH